MGPVDFDTVSGTRLFCIALALTWGCLACAPKQRVSFDCVPRDVQVFVDGRALEMAQEGVALRSDRAHTVFFKGGGFEPQMVVLESREAEGVAHLVPADVCSRTAFVPTRPQVELRIDPEEPASSPEP